MGEPLITSIPSSGNSLSELSSAKPMQRQQGPSIFAEFKENGNNQVDMSDVKYSSETTGSNIITEFINAHLGENWSNDLIQQFNKIIARFNMSNRANVLHSDIESMVTTGEAQEPQNANGTGDSYAVLNGDGTSTVYNKDGKIQTYDAGKTPIESHDKTENAGHQKSLSMNDMIKNSKITVAKAGGTLTVTSENINGTIKYNANDQTYTVSLENKEPKVIDENKLNEILDILLANGVQINGSAMVITKSG